MTLITIHCEHEDAATIPTFGGRIAVFADTALDPAARQIDRRLKGALSRAMADSAWSKLKPGEALDLAYPAGLAASSVLLVRLPRNAGADETRKAGARIARGLGEGGALIAARAVKRLGALAEGLALRAYEFTIRAEAATNPGAVVLAVADPEATRPAIDEALIRAEAVHFTRDLVNAPANILTTTEFAARIEAMRDLGLTVEVLDEAELEHLGLRALLAVGQGSESPSKLAIMQWKGAEGPPLALVGKGLVFDAGGISIKPALGMEEMTMDMGGAGVVAGVMRLIARRKAKAHVVGVVGLVENMPDGRAQRPGDVVRSMKGDTIEVINTDAEGRLVLADALWYTQERFKPAAIIDLATLTNGIMVALGFVNAGVFSNDDALCADLLNACRAEGEGAWRMPLDPDYDVMIESRIADVKNHSGQLGGAITAARLLQRFVPDGLPWAHIDIAGVALRSSETDLAPKGASGWGVRALDTLIRARFEG